ncbi:hypothetical protein [Parvularcula sp. LCG005]|uniref:hypothetical protein n=1 Tax=Parvularcula sp. LCG005 TaxID=3078805 RepID=UPI002942D654|nr:hypothetical protein [Parvularcula sp. LCG005]WOI53221.1 hypothetical protein RUI03_13825 [Parvularcula sp. LCG005]
MILPTLVSGIGFLGAISDATVVYDIDASIREPLGADISVSHTLKTVMRIEEGRLPNKPPKGSTGAYFQIDIDIADDGATFLADITVCDGGSDPCVPLATPSLIVPFGDAASVAVDGGPTALSYSISFKPHQP